MRSSRPKVLHEIGHAPMLVHAMRSALSLAPRRLAVVVGHGAEAVAEAARAAAPDVAVCLQESQRGTGDALRAAAPALSGFEGRLLVMFGDTPFVRPETLAAMAAALERHDLAVLGFEAAEPGRYGRLVTGPAGLERIVEAKDATPEELAIRVCNSGVMAGDCATMLRLLGSLSTENAQGEYYLTDLVGLARGEGRTVGLVLCPEAETLGINDRAGLAAAEAVFQAGARAAAMAAGATLTAPETVFFAHDTVLAPDVVVEPNVVFGPGVRVAEGARIRAFSHLEGAEVGPGAVIGPYARLRPGTRLAEDVRIGNFVEVKNAEIGAGAKANHLSYLGDATVGAGANIGAGTITCNYDGVNKHRTEIGAGAFIGTNSSLVAPVTVAPGAYVATATTVTRDVPAEALAIGRAPQQNREGAAARLRQVLAARKAARAARKD
ncbi:bifunctional UDP-N-acetylglucosamine diphosphorylase/glucosamine-1-phosphate N-acetyltransferase GlmU [Paralimibaculum aggregatum]|uniref:Bifunctional protein GlmU n=2 Tax=Paralimibaculum aggregatum TaxID=3036245 RepID=A0ABQ6LDF9_9RHOB|nr:bifunctional UDP-N-acetylglucosamine diphosphorylase/glucosamine-1-phosphate N-acetyltransferase GlmU [Limibaculum sp. NKW23]